MQQSGQMSKMTKNAAKSGGKIAPSPHRRVAAKSINKMGVT